MRYLSILPMIGLAAVLSACGHSSTSTVTAIAPPTYSIGGSIAGLSGMLVLQNNGGDNLSLSHDGSFAFDITLQPNSTYDVTIAAQPANQVCVISNGSGTATSSVTNVTVVCSLSATASDVWTWVGGSDQVNSPGDYGTQGVPAASNTPGARRQPIAWTDSSGNFWLFGGNSVGNVGMLNDLWEYSPAAEQWVLQGGSNKVGAAASYGTQGVPAASNNPGAREGAAKWSDAAGNLWLFGGDTIASQNFEEFADLWQYNVSTSQWTWVGGSNVAVNAANAASSGSYSPTPGVPAAGNLPPARTGAMTWVDSAGLFWLLGGAQLNSNGGYSAVFNDLWNYNPTTGLWTWVGGSNMPNATGVYNIQGSATPPPGSAPNVPGARLSGSIWLDASGNVWLFGGVGLSGGLAQEYGDLWEYNPTTALWTWVGGSNMANAAGVYGTQRAAAVGNGPGARGSAASWKDQSGNFWLFGGYGYAQVGLGNLNDLWEYNLGTGVWTWISGSSSIGASGTYGTQGIPASNNIPGSRYSAGSWTDSSGNFWLFGGFGFDSSGVQDDMNDLWRFSQSP